MIDQHTNNMNMNILYLHGMGGGSTSRMPVRLKQVLSNMHFTKDGEPCKLNVVCKTYNFDPEVATNQIAEWVETYQPALVMSESMGAIHALGIQGVPHIWLSPALNYDRGATFFQPMVSLANMLGFTYTKQRGANRQEIRGDYELVAKFKPMIQSYKEAILSNPQRDPSYAFFGNKDPYRTTDIVSIKEYQRLYGDSYEMFDGGHCLDVRQIRPKLLPKIVEMLGLEEVKPTPRKNRNQTN